MTGFCPGTIAVLLTSLAPWTALFPVAGADRDGKLEVSLEDTAATVSAALAALSKPPSQRPAIKSSPGHRTSRYVWRDNENSEGAFEFSAPTSLLSLSTQSEMQREHRHAFHGADDFGSEDTAVDSLQSSHDPCYGKFGSLTPDYTTVVDLDYPNGCGGNTSQNGFFLHFVGGPSCAPPEPQTGCHRYVITRYNAGCDLSEIQSNWKTTVQPGDVFGKDGIYKKCKDSMHTAETRYYPAAGTGRCDEAICSSTGESAKSPKSENSATPAAGALAAVRLACFVIVLAALA